MHIRIRQPDAPPRDIDCGPSSAYLHTHTFARQGERVVGERGSEAERYRRERTVSMDPRAIANREAVRRWRERQKAART